MHLQAIPAQAEPGSAHVCYQEHGGGTHRSPLGFILADNPSRTVYVCAQYGQSSCGAIGRLRLPSAVTAGAGAASRTEPPSARRLFSRLTTSRPAYALRSVQADASHGWSRQLLLRDGGG